MRPAGEHRPQKPPSRTFRRGERRSSKWRRPASCVQAKAGRNGLGSALAAADSDQARSVPASNSPTGWSRNGLVAVCRVGFEQSACGSGGSFVLRTGQETRPTDGLGDLSRGRARSPVSRTGQEPRPTDGSGDLSRGWAGRPGLRTRWASVSQPILKLQVLRAADRRQSLRAVGRQGVISAATEPGPRVRCETGLRGVRLPTSDGRLRCTRSPSNRL